MSGLILAVTDAHDVGAEAVIANGLAQYNEMQSGIRGSRPLKSSCAPLDTDTVLGGLTGRTSLSLFFIDLFFLPDRLRGSGVGSRVLEVAEQEARRRGCGTAALYTINFQAPGFYERRGYQRFGVSVRSTRYQPYVLHRAAETGVNTEGCAADTPCQAPLGP